MIKIIFFLNIDLVLIKLCKFDVGQTSDLAALQVKIFLQFDIIFYKK